MKSYKNPSFQDRVSRAAEAKRKALEEYRSRPPLDAAVVAERKAASFKRETANAARIAAKKAAKEAETEAAAAEAAAKTVVPARLSEAERKARRDARYAARKNRM
jgi:hypothetical protein